MVSKKRILARPLGFYRAALAWWRPIPAMPGTPGTPSSGCGT
jgi:hypothetical protein